MRKGGGEEARSVRCVRPMETGLLSVLILMRRAAAFAKMILSSSSKFKIFAYVSIFDVEFDVPRDIPSRIFVTARTAKSEGGLCSASKNDVEKAGWKNGDGTMNVNFLKMIVLRFLLTYAFSAGHFPQPLS